MDEFDFGSEITNDLSKTWRGTSIMDICKGKGHWSFSVTPLTPSKYHCVLYEMPVTLQGPPKPHYKSQAHLWDDDHVRMPCSEKNLFPVSENGKDIIKPRWTIIKDALSKPISSSYEFEAAICKYHSALPKFEALHYFFNETLEPEESEPFFTSILPDMIKLALKLPEWVPSGIPLLKQNHNRSVSLSQMQIACLLANAFLCTFPSKMNVTRNYPGVNMIGLFSASARPKRTRCVSEKLKCLCNYFRRVTQNNPAGVVTFERKFIPRSSMPRWDKLENNLGNTRMHISSEGTIEDNGLGFLQVDFANKFLGGGVLRYGCVQEEIRFVICPELIVSGLFVEVLGHTEAAIITGVERYNNYTGYGDSFEWESNCYDDTPFDVYGRRRTTICAIDAIPFRKTKQQFQSGLMLRELNKAYIGFSSREKENLAPVATGNWGCGAFQGSKPLKALIQLMACSAAKRDMVYYSFGDDELMENLYQIHMFLANNQITIAQLWHFLCRFEAADLREERLYPFIQQSYFDREKPNTISKYFFKPNESTKERPLSSSPSTSSRNNKLLNTHSQEVSFPKKSKIDEEAMDIIEEPTVSSSSSSEDIIPSSQPELKSFKKNTKFKHKKTSEDIIKKLPKTDICDILDILDGNANQSNNVVTNSERCAEEEGILSLFDTFTAKKCSKTSLEEDEVSISNKEISETTLEEVVVGREEKMEVDGGTMQANQKDFKKKITDYFIKTNK